MQLSIGLLPTAMTWALHCVFSFRLRPRLCIKRFGAISFEVLARGTELAAPLGQVAHDSLLGVDLQGFAWREAFGQRMRAGSEKGLKKKRTQENFFEIFASMR